MKRPAWLPGVIVCGLLATADSSSASLLDRGLFDNGLGTGNQVRLIYDDDLDVTWLGDANFVRTWVQSVPGAIVFPSGAWRLPSGETILGSGAMNWETAVAWADDLSVGGFSDWRLPTTVQPDPSCSTQQAAAGFPIQGSGNGCTLSEMGHLFHMESISLAATGAFDHLDSSVFYWSGTKFAPEVGTLSESAWEFSFFGGAQALGGINRSVFQRAWAVRDGDVRLGPSIPVPATTWLLVMGLLALGRKTARGTRIRT